MSADKRDDRFGTFATDAKFRSVSKRTKKVKIDERFAAIFNDPDFGASNASRAGKGRKRCRVDERGRPGKAFDAKENLKRFYRLEDEDDHNENDEDNVINEDNKNALKEARIKKRLGDLSVDYARGEAPIESSTDDDISSSSDEDDEDEEENNDEEDQKEVDAFDKWGELDHDALRPQHQQATNRLAVCNMDWDRVGADDLFLALASFAPNNSLESVHIYMSDFGKERMAKEEQLGPEELRTGVKELNDDDEDDDEVKVGDDEEEERERRAVERVRRYQIGRLRYYYAVVTFDSPSSADVVYRECDGMEYELSVTRFDLRFVDDDTHFDDQEAVQVCNAMPDVSKYKPKAFLTSALTMGKKVNLTWDETDPERQRVMKRAFDNLDEDHDDQDDQEINKYVAASSDDDQNDAEDESDMVEDIEEERATAEDDSDDDDHDEVNGEEDLDDHFSDEGDSIEKYRALIADIKASNERKEAKEGEMEVTFAADTDHQIDKQTHEENVSKLTPWEAYLEKRRRKKRDKLDAKKTDKTNNEPSNDDDGQISDDYFDDDDDEDKLYKSKKKNRKGNSNKRKKMSNEEEDAEEEQRRAELDLMAMDSDEDNLDQGHFDYKDILQEERKKNKKKKKKRSNDDKNNVNLELQEDFQINVSDSRFTALYDNPDFNIDPSHPSFKRSEANVAVLNEKQRRRFGNDTNEDVNLKTTQKPTSSTPQLQSLASKVAAKTKERKKRLSNVHNSSAAVKKNVKKRIKRALKRRDQD